MRNRVTSLLFLLIITCFLFPSTLLAQSLTQDERRFWDKYMIAKDEGDEEYAIKMIRQNKKRYHAIFEKLTIRLCGQSDAIDEEMAKTLAEDMYTAFRDESYNYIYNYITSLDMFQRSKRQKAWDHFFNGFLQFNHGKQSNNETFFKRAIKHLSSALALTEEIEDYELMAKVAMRCAMAHAALEEHYEACTHYGKSLEAMEALPFQPMDHRFVEVEYDTYIRKGYDPTLPKDEGGEPLSFEDLGCNSIEELAPTDRPEFKDNPDLVITRCTFTPMKKPEQFVTSDFYTATNPLLWLETGFDANSKTFKELGYYWGFGLSFFGKPIFISRERTTFYLDIDRDVQTQQEIQATAKVGKILLADKGRNASKYQFFVQTPSQEEAMFDLILNNAAQQRNTIKLRMRTGCFMKGKIAGQKCMIIDDNSNGTFGDFTYRSDDGITEGEIFFYRPDAIVIGNEKKARPWSLLQRIDEQFYMVATNATGKSLRTVPHDFKTGTIRLEWEGAIDPQFVILRYLDPMYPGVFFDVAGSRDPVVVPQGYYEIACGKIEKGKGGKAKQIRIYNGKSDRIEVVAGEETVLELGGPFHFTFETKSVGREFTVKGPSVNVFGKRGEQYACFFDDVPLPQVSIRTANKKTKLLRNKKMKQATRDDYYRKPSNVWHPLDFVYEKKSGMELEAMLSLKKIPLLGGPVESDWQ